MGQFLRGRSLIQTTLTLQILVLGGCPRPGALIATSHYPKFSICWKARGIDNNSSSRILDVILAY